MADQESTPKLHVDSDWKAQAQAEMARLVEQEQAKANAGDTRGAGKLPPADFKGLVGVLASQAIMGLGAMGDPKSGRVVVDLPGAQFSIDLLAVLEEKTKGNIDDDDANELRQIISELRGRFVQISQLLAQQVAASPQTTTAAPGGQPTPPLQP